jgi:putative spermidine/putrescine transport system permease protein
MRARSLMMLWSACVYALLLAPVCVLVLASFDDARFFMFPPRVYSLRWYAAAAGSAEYRDALAASVTVALVATAISVAAGSAAAYALVRFRPPGAAVFEAVLGAPLVLPLIVWGIALLQIYAWLGLTGTLAGLVLAHAVITLPYTVRVMLTSFARMDPELEAAAASLGASPWRVARHVIVPLALPGLATSAAFSLLISFNEVVVSSLIAGSRWITFPVRLYAQLRSEGIDPITLAIGAGIIVIILAGSALGEVTIKWSRHL